MPNQILAIVLGTWTTKVVHLEYRDEVFHLHNYLLQETPPRKEGHSREVLAQHFKNIKKAIGGKVSDAVLVVGMTDSMLRLVEMPLVEPSDLRRIIKANSRNYFQQDLSDYVFDCAILPTSETKSTDASARHKKCDVLTVGAKSQFITDLEAAARDAGLVPTQITLSQVSLIDAAVRAMPEVIEKETVALVDLGFSSSTISVLIGGKPVLTRVVGIGGNKVTSDLAETFNITHQVAEGIKAVMPEKVQAKIETTLSALADELRAAVDFVQHHMEKEVSQIFMSGGQARSGLIVEILQNQLHIPCRTWDATTFLKLDLPPEKTTQVAKDAPQLAAAIGAATSWFKPQQVRIDLLAEKNEILEMRRRDPVRRGSMVSVYLILFMLTWAGYLYIRFLQIDADLIRHNPDLAALKTVEKEISRISKETIETEGKVAALVENSTNRFLWAPVLNALQQGAMEQVQIMALSINRDLIFVERVKSPPKKATMSERITLSIQAKNFAGQSAQDQFIEQMAAIPYFRNNLRKEGSILLKSSQPRQVDPNDPSKTFNLFTIECVFQERIVGYD